MTCLENRTGLFLSPQGLKPLGKSRFSARLKAVAWRTLGGLIMRTTRAVGEFCTRRRGPSARIAPRSDEAKNGTSG